MEYQVMDEPSHVWIHRKNMFSGKVGVETQPINMIKMVLAYLIGYPSIFAWFILHSLIQSARNWWVHHLSLALPLADRRRPHHGPTVGSWSQLTYSSGVGRHNGSETMAIPKSVQIGMLDGLLGQNWLIISWPIFFCFKEYRLKQQNMDGNNRSSGWRLQMIQLLRCAKHGMKLLGQL
jgi:hypothetical protein